MRYAWLPMLKKPVPDTLQRPLDAAKFEARQIADPVCFALEPALGEGYRIEKAGDGYTVAGGETGVLYGAYALIRALSCGEALPEGVQRPYYPLRMINCWDNMDGSIERGYAGRSLWFEGDAFHYDPARIRQLGRMLASVGINVLCVNNVNVHWPAQQLIGDLLPDLAAFAGILRPFGVRLMVSVDFSMPLQCGLDTADPLDSRVQAWWKQRADAVYAAVPDLAGFLVKADSEHRPGPNAYGRDHAQGANMLARALAPHGGALVWRAFVYNCLQDWRDHSVDRPCAAYETYMPLDGSFDDNVILQIKNGPYDFQVREPESPLFYGLRHTPMGLEFQLAQEYTGQQIDLYTMAPLWREIFEDLPQENLSAAAAVSNLGRDENYFGHPLAAANFFGFGLMSWNPDFSPAESVAQWIRLTYDFSAEQADNLKRWMLSSREIYELYAGQLGLCWMITPHTHYGPNPSGYEYDLWGTYHRASRDAVGIDRTEKGTGYISQYPPELAARYRDPETCPDNLLLFFHRLPYSFALKDGCPLIQRLYDDHFEGAELAARMERELTALPFPEPDAGEIARRAAKQRENAENWRDVINTFFHRLSGVPDARGRKIYD